MTTLDDSFSCSPHDSAQGFISQLLAAEADWPPAPHLWRFRGHASANWKLVPSALRTGTRLAFHERPIPTAPCASYQKQLEAEYTLLKVFFDRMDAAGVAIPGDSQLHRSSQLDDWWQQWLAQIRAGKDTWPPHDLLSLMAVAQHYGIPTRLLDWTRNPLVAAYIAAKDALTKNVEDEQDDGTLCVWAFSMKALQRISTAKRESPWIEVVSAPSASIPNLAAQEGTFTLVHDPQGSDDRLRVRPLDQVLRELLSGTKPSGPSIVKLTLPRTEASELLRRLAYYGVDAATVYAGHSAAAAAVRERELWDRSDPAWDK